MEAELERFHKNNTQLELNINEIKQKWKATEKELQKERQAVIENYENCPLHTYTKLFL